VILGRCRSSSVSTRPRRPRRSSSSTRRTAALCARPGALTRRAPRSTRRRGGMPCAGRSTRLRWSENRRTAVAAALLSGRCRAQRLSRGCGRVGPGVGPADNPPRPPASRSSAWPHSHDATAHDSARPGLWGLSAGAAGRFLARRAPHAHSRGPGRSPATGTPTAVKRPEPPVGRVARPPTGDARFGVAFRPAGRIPLVIVKRRPGGFEHQAQLPGGATAPAKPKRRRPWWAWALLALLAVLMFRGPLLLTWETSDAGHQRARTGVASRATPVRSHHHHLSHPYHLDPDPSRTGWGQP